MSDISLAKSQPRYLGGYYERRRCPTKSRRKSCKNSSASGPKQELPVERCGRDGALRGYVFTRSADFQSAVSPICNRQSTDRSQDGRFCPRSAGCKPAIQQTSSLRYEPRQHGKQILLPEGEGRGEGKRSESIECKLDAHPTKYFMPKAKS